MRKPILYFALGAALVCSLGAGIERNIQTTAYTRTLLRASTSAVARATLNTIADSDGSSTNQSIYTALTGIHSSSGFTFNRNSSAGTASDVWRFGGTAKWQITATANVMQFKDNNGPVTYVEFDQTVPQTTFGAPLIVSSSSTYSGAATFNAAVKATSTAQFNQAATFNFSEAHFFTNMTDALSDGTNWHVDFRWNDVKLTATNDVFFLLATNFSSTSNKYEVEYTVIASGADRPVYFDTNYHCFTTNQLTLSGAYWKALVTNGYWATFGFSAYGGNNKTNVKAWWCHERR